MNNPNTPSMVHPRLDNPRSNRLHPVRGESRILLAGLDLGTATSRLVCGWQENEGVDLKTISPTSVGVAKEGLVESLLPGNARILFGQEAIRHRLRLNMAQPVVSGRIQDVSAAGQFLRYLVEQLPADPGAEIRAVAGIPADATTAECEAIREAMAGAFDAALLIPKPFLAALGIRDESRLADPDYVDPIRNSIFIDLGA
ncbi:MAG: hypothetical protein FJ405_17495, partial [Verrucomicrobia bacterium]|nr:hypothetical protein [Verrucomicrobiota bacterium]